METLSRARAVPRAASARDARARAHRVATRAAGAPPSIARAGRRARARDDRDRDAMRPRERERDVAVCSLARSSAEASASRRGRRRRECVVYWDLDNARPPANVEVRRSSRRRDVAFAFFLLCFSSRAMSALDATIRPAYQLYVLSPREPRVKRPGNNDVDHQKLLQSSSVGGGVHEVATFIYTFFVFLNRDDGRTDGRTDVFFYFARRRCGRRDFDAWAKSTPTRVASSRMRIHRRCRD